jgi:hypothetical protein
MQETFEITAADVVAHVSRYRRGLCGSYKALLFSSGNKTSMRLSWQGMIPSD